MSGKLTRHLFVCIGPDYCGSERGQEAWNYVKRRMKELGLAGRWSRVSQQVSCFRICIGGPIAVVYPKARGIEV